MNEPELHPEALDGIAQAIEEDREMGVLMIVGCAYGGRTFHFDAVKWLRRKAAEIRERRDREKGEEDGR